MAVSRVFEKSRISGKQKAAMLLLSLDVETATQVLRKLTQEELEAVTLEIANIRGATPPMIEQVTDEFYQLIVAQQYVIQGGLEYAQKLLEKTLGFNKAADIIEKVKMLSHVTGFDTLKKADPRQLASFLQKEHPQTIALILANLPPDQTANVLSEFPIELRVDVTYRMATLGKIAPSLITEMENVLEDVAETEISQNMSVLGGTKSVATVLNRCTTVEARQILEELERRDQNLAQEIKRLMFLFEDIIFIDDKGIQRLLREVDKRDLAMAMKVADDKLKEKILKNMSERARELLNEELQFMGPVRLKEVEAAQTRIVEIVKQLEEAGEIVVAGRGGKEEVFV
ncbi:MAG: flagellar motor switch protein FliG [Bacteroidetes bacterium]|nr:flagellar motor switch protein FliG [Bacteroidota bacterium]